MRCPLCETDMIYMGHGDHVCPACHHVEHATTFRGVVTDTYDYMQRSIEQLKDQH